MAEDYSAGPEIQEPTDTGLLTLLVHPPGTIFQTDPVCSPNSTDAAFRRHFCSQGTSILSKLGTPIGDAQYKSTHRHPINQ